MRKYKKEFADEVRALYGDYDLAMKCLDSNNAFLGRILYDSIPNGIQPSEILEAETPEEIVQLKKKAELAKRKAKLYADWFDGICWEDSD